MRNVFRAFLAAAAIAATALAGSASIAAASSDNLPSFSERYEFDDAWCFDYGDVTDCTVQHVTAVIQYKSSGDSSLRINQRQSITTTDNATGLQVGSAEALVGRQDGLRGRLPVEDVHGPPHPLRRPRWQVHLDVPAEARQLRGEGRPVPGPRLRVAATNGSIAAARPSGAPPLRATIAVMSPTPIDLRSDTVTRPSAGMRAAMAAAEVGDDQFGDDPTVNRLQERIADLLGKEAALWLPTGTMANQVVLRSLTRPGDDVIVSREAHAVWHETGGSGANAGVQLTELGGPGWFTAAEFEAAVKPRGHLIYPPTTLVEVENTHNRAGGVVVPPSTAEAIAEAARRLGIASYLDGARLWNAAVVSGRSVAELAAPFDVAMVSLSKGLGAPGGSVVAARRELLPALVRYRRMSGGAMRQVGIFAAAGLWALDQNPTGWPRTTPTLGRSRSGSRRARPTSSTRPASRRTSSSGSYPMRPRPTRRRSWTAPGNVAC